MSDLTANNIQIETTVHSHFDQVDFDNLTFGSVFTDHMLVSDYQDGQWSEPKIIPYQPITLSPAAKVFHYGQTIFEGMKAYRDDNDEIFLFRPDENQKRLNISAARLSMPAFPEVYFLAGIKALISLEKNWIPRGDGGALYIRPFMLATEPEVSASPSKSYQFITICSPVKSYFEGDVSVRIATEYSRAADGGVGFAKAGGNYAAQFLPTVLANQEGYQQVIWTDANTHEKLEEAGTMNIFFRLGDKLVTAPTSDRILDGITRKSLIQLAQDQGIDIEVRDIYVHEIIEAAQNQQLKEIFGAGTATVVSVIKGFAYKDQYFEIGTMKAGFAQQLKQMLVAIQTNQQEDPYGWRVKV